MDIKNFIYLLSLKIQMSLKYYTLEIELFYIRSYNILKNK
jgi:hypothetical protein